MKVIVYYPKSPEDMIILQKRVAAVHAEAVLRYINKISCPKGQKVDMINSLIEKACPDVGSFSS